jgi:hypothetical protein
MTEQHNPVIEGARVVVESLATGAILIILLLFGGGCAHYAIMHFDAPTWKVLLAGVTVIFTWGVVALSVVGGIGSLLGGRR